MASRSITDISVEGVQKRPLNQSKGKQTVFAIKVTWSDGTVNVIYRTYRNFYELEERLVQAFNDAEKSKTKKSRVVPKLEGKDKIRSDEQKKWGWIDNFCMALLDLPTAISECEILEDFFTPTPDDLTSNKRRKEEENNTKAKKKKEKRRKKKFSSIKMIGSPFHGEECQVLEDYKRQTDQEISLKEGKIVTVVLKREDGWWMINADDENGWAPGSYLIPVIGEEGQHDSEEAAPGEGEMFQSLKAYKAKEEDELSFPVGVTLQIVKKNLDGWWTALYMGRKGCVPAIYLKKLGNKKKHRGRFSIKRLTLKTRKSRKSTRLAKASENWHKNMENHDATGSEPHKRIVRKISFADDLDIPPRARMSVKRKKSSIRDPNENQNIVSFSPSEVDSKPVEPNKEDNKVNESEAIGDEKSNYPKLTLLRRKRSQSFSFTTEKNIPHIKITSPTLSRSLSLDSVVKPHGTVSPTTSYEALPSSQRFDAQNPSKNSNAPIREEVFDGLIQRKQSFSGSETSITSKNSSLDRRRKKGTVFNPMTVKPDNSRTYDTQQTLEKKNLLHNSGQLYDNKNLPREEQNIKESKSLPRGSGLQRSNLLVGDNQRLSSSTPYLNQIGTIKQTDWQPQHFDDLHPNFQRKALKIAKKTYEDMTNKSRSNERPASALAVMVSSEEEQNMKESKSLPRRSKLQQSNLLVAEDNRLSSSTPNLNQIDDTTKKTHWKPQQFDDLHPNFQRKALKIAKKTYEDMTNERNERLRSETERPNSGNHFDQPDGLRGENDNSSFEGTKNVKKTGFKKRSPKKGGQVKDNVSSVYSDVELESLSSGNRSRSPSPFPRPGSSASVSSTLSSMSSGSLSETEFNYYNKSESRERHQLDMGFSSNIENGWESFDEPPTYSLPDCPELYRAFCGYEAENSKELSFLGGELLEVIKQADNGWWLAKVGSKKGWVPSNYLQSV